MPAKRPKMFERHRYTVTYQNGARTATRLATSAVNAIEAQCRRYGWSCRLVQCDDSHGKDWAECYIDRNGGGDYAERVRAERQAE